MVVEIKNTSPELIAKFEKLKLVKNSIHDCIKSGKSLSGIGINFIKPI